MAIARSCETATLLPNGNVLVAGGRIIQGPDSLASAELYDPQSGVWSATQAMVAPRGCHTATLLPDGKVLVAGGTGGDGSALAALASADLYDPASGTWSATASMVAARRGHTATLLPDGKVLVAGGGGIGPTSAELYDPGSGN
jgi:hypothetical protein